MNCNLKAECTNLTTVFLDVNRWIILSLVERYMKLGWNLSMTVDRIASILVTVLSRALNTPSGIPSVITFVVIENFYIHHHSVVNVQQNSSWTSFHSFVNLWPCMVCWYRYICFSHLHLAFLRFSSKFQTDKQNHMKNRLQQFTKFIPCIFST